MATMIEKKVASVQKEIEKYSKSLDRNNNRASNKWAACEKLGCAWTEEEWYTNRDAATNEQAYAWFEWSVVQSEIKDTTHRLENAQSRLAKMMGEYEASVEAPAEAERIESLGNGWYAAQKTAEELKAEYEAWLAEFKAECLKDGIVIDEAYHNYINGTTKAGKRFCMSINNGWTERSLVSYTLYINGATIFTSGLFSTGYRYLKMM